MSFKALLAYQKAFDLAMDIFHATKSFPLEERYVLSSQIVRSSRNVWTQMRRFIAKEFMKSTSEVSLLMRTVRIQKLNFGWILHLHVTIFQQKNEKVYNIRVKKSEKLLNYMINNPGKFGV